MKVGGKPILERSQDYLAQYTSESTDGTPLYYASYDYDNWMIAPAPAVDTPVEIIYYSRVQPLDSTNQENLFTRECPQALLFGTLLQAQGYLKALDKLPVWKQYLTVIYSTKIYFTLNIYLNNQSGKYIKKGYKHLTAS